jgi:hypothetical protein
MADSPPARHGARAVAGERVHPDEGDAAAPDTRRLLRSEIPWPEQSEVRRTSHRAALVQVPHPDVGVDAVARKWLADRDLDGQHRLPLPRTAERHGRGGRHHGHGPSSRSRPRSGTVLGARENIL